MDFTVPSSFGKFIEQLTWQNVCKAAAILLAAHMLHVGLWAFLHPTSLCKAFGMRSDGKYFNGPPAEKPTSKSGKQTDDSENFWPYLFAPREVGFGALILVLAAMRDWKAVGVVVAVVGGLLATADGAVAGIYGKGGWYEAVKSHFIPGVIIGAVAAVILME